MSSRPVPALEKPLPSNLEAERSILGAILAENRALIDALKTVHSQNFFLPQHQIIFRNMCQLGEANSGAQTLVDGRGIDLVTLTEQLFKNGELERAGGTPYLASLVDGMPRISNIEHYATIVLEKWKRRQLIHAAHNAQELAWAPDVGLDDIRRELQAGLERSTGDNSLNSLNATDLLDFLPMKLDPIEFVIEPILPVGNSAMIFSTPGAGKTYIMLHMAYCVAIGADNCFVWDVHSKRPVCYVDGEMDSISLQERMLEIAKGWDMVLPERNFFKLVTPDLQPKFPPRINKKEGRAQIEEHATEGGLLILDNLFTLCPGADEKETEDWAAIQEWILHLRRRRIAVFIVQHSNRSGEQQYGTSKREIQLACNLMLRNATDYTPEQGLRVEARLKKLRRRGKDGRWEPRWGQPFEISYRVDSGAAVFSTRPMLEILKKRAVEMLQAGMRENDVASETGLDRFKIYRLKRKIKEAGANAAIDE